MSITTLINRVAISFACFISLGILVHDTKFDKAFSLALPVAAISFGLSSHVLDFHDGVHTHVERVHLNHALQGMPRKQPRNDMRKYFAGRTMSQSGDFFGGNRILWPSADVV